MECRPPATRIPAIEEGDVAVLETLRQCRDLLSDDDCFAALKAAREVLDGVMISPSLVVMCSEYDFVHGLCSRVGAVALEPLAVAVLDVLLALCRRSQQASEIVSWELDALLSRSVDLMTLRGIERCVRLVGVLSDWGVSIPSAVAGPYLALARSPRTVVAFMRGLVEFVSAVDADCSVRDPMGDALASGRMLAGRARDEFLMHLGLFLEYSALQRDATLWEEAGGTAALAEVMRSASSAAIAAGLAAMVRAAPVAPSCLELVDLGRVLEEDDPIVLRNAVRVLEAGVASGNALWWRRAADVAPQLTELLESGPWEIRRRLLRVFAGLAARGAEMPWDGVVRGIGSFGDGEP